MREAMPSRIFQRAAVDRAAANFPLYHLPHILSIDILNKDLPRIIPKFVYIYYLQI